MKKLYVALIISILTLILTACSGGGGTDTTDTTAAILPSEESTTSAASTEAQTTEAQTTEAQTVTTAPATTEAPTAATTETETDAPAPVTTAAQTTAEETETEKYVDLSAENTLIHKDNTTYFSVQAEGNGKSTISLAFDGEGITLGRWNQDHECLDCEECGFVEKNGKNAFRICTEGHDMAGITVVLNKPVFAKAVKDIKITFMSSVGLTFSELRVMPATGTDTGIFSNVCPVLSGATENWRTVSLGISNMSSIADSDGFIRAFKLYFRDKNSAEVFLHGISIDCSGAKEDAVIREMATLNNVPGNSFYKNGALKNIAETVAARFESVGVEAKVLIRCQRYENNGYVTDGSIVYTAIVSWDGGSYTVQNITAKVPRVKNCYLEISDGEYGVARDSKEQWKTSLDDAGILTLRDNVITTADGICKIEYALLGMEEQYADVGRWYPPQATVMDSESVSLIYINSLMDYGKRLCEGEQYRLVVRATTKGGNYVIHLDVAFTYAPLSEDVEKDLSGALEALGDGEFNCPADCTDVAAEVAKQAEALVGIDGIKVIPTVTSRGITCAWVDLYLCYTKDISTDRLNGADAYYDCVGDAYKLCGVRVACEAPDSPIKHVSPADGEYDVTIASDAIIKHMNTPVDVLGSSSYYYKIAELCTPPPVRLEWRDEVAAEGKTYTVYLSENADYSDPFAVVETTECYAEVVNLKAGTQYYWVVEADGVRSAGAGFVTSDKYPRFVDVDGVSNIRDIGGYTTLDGKTVKQGIVYRSAYLDLITEEGKTVILGQLGVITDLDLRGESDASPLGEDVNIIATGVKHYHWAFAEDTYEAMRVAIAAFADINNYPMVYHCYIGRDRTGTVTALILGILGVDEETVKKEYMLSLNSTAGHDATSHTKLYEHIETFIEGLKDYGGNTFNESAEAYLLRIGVTPEEIESIRNILLE